MITQEIKVIAFPGAPNLPVFAALEHGYFSEQGMAVALSTTPNSVSQIERFHAGEFELAFTAFDNIVAYREGMGAVALKGTPDFRVIMGATQVELSAIVAPAIKTADDLRGKTLALDAVGTGFAFVLYAMLEELGLSANDYGRVAVGATPERWKSVKDGAHVGTMTIEPFTSIATAAGFRVLRNSTETFPVYQGGIVAARAELGGEERRFREGLHPRVSEGPRLDAGAGEHGAGGRAAAGEDAGDQARRGGCGDDQPAVAALRPHPARRRPARRHEDGARPALALRRRQRAQRRRQISRSVVLRGGDRLLIRADACRV